MSSETTCLVCLPSLLGLNENHSRGIFRVSKEGVDPEKQYRVIVMNVALSGIQEQSGGSP
jgi:hypothetical protein